MPATPTPAPVTPTPPPAPVHVSIAPSSGPAGTIFTVTWSGFTPNATLTSHLRRPDGSAFPPMQFSTDAAGRAARTINSTGFAPGRYTHWAIDDRTGRQTAQITFEVTAVPATPTPAPVTLTPEQLSMALFGRIYPVTQSYLNLWEGNPTPDRRHAGIDFGAPAGTPVRAVRDGEVLYAGGDYGTVSVFDGCNTVIFLHLESIRVISGQRITFRTIIGNVGSAGAESAHLHIEVRRGRQRYAVGLRSGGTTAALTYDPLQYLITSQPSPCNRPYP